MRILVVDDDPLVRQLLDAVLTMEGWTVEQASSGEDGLAACDKSPPDVVTLDYSMPFMTGLEVAERLVAGNFDRPIFVFSAAHTPELEADAAALGVTALPKSELNQLVQMIRDLPPPPVRRRWLRGGHPSG